MKVLFPMRRNRKHMMPYLFAIFKRRRALLGWELVDTSARLLLVRSYLTCLDMVLIKYSVDSSRVDGLLSYYYHHCLLVGTGGVNMGNT